MKKLVLPIFLIIVSVGLVIWYVQPIFSEISQIRSKQNEINQALGTGKELSAVVEAKRQVYNQVTEADRVRLNKLLPDNTDNVRLIIDINEIASKIGLTIRNISVGINGNQSGVGPDNREYGVATLNFSVSASYGLFKVLIAALEDSLRLVDVSSVSFSAGDKDLNEYNIEIKTYWLKSL
ncbi:MAG: type 4a pilus biogenesis protein PilO [Candidatus Paceibacterota bacterium]